MTALLDQIRDSLEGPIDFEGQRKADQYTNWILPASAALAFVAGYAAQDLRLTLGVFAIGFVVALVVVVPPWSMYRQNPVQWLPVQEATITDATIAAPESKKSR